MRWRLIRGLLSALVILAVSPLLGIATPNAAPDPTQPTPTPTSRPMTVTRLAQTYAKGVGTYLGGDDQATTFNLPLVRTDAPYDTMIHVSNATAAFTLVTLTFYNDNGFVVATETEPLAVWGTIDDDLGVSGQVPSGFVGTANVIASSGISVVVDVTNTSQPSDNLDTYAAIPASAGLGPNALPPSAFYYLPFIPSLTGTVDPTIYLRNLSTTTTSNVDLTFNWTNPPNGPPPTPVIDSITIPKQGGYQVPVSQLSGIAGNNFDAAVTIVSTNSLPLAITADVPGGGTYWNAADVSGTGTTFYVPRFDFNTTTSSPVWNTGIVMLNTAQQPQAFTVSIYNPDGSLALAVTSDPIQPMGLFKFNFYGQYENLSLPSGFAGSAVVTSPSGAVGWVSRDDAPAGTASFSATASYIMPTAPLPGNWSYLPSLRKISDGAGAAGVESTGFAMQNTQATLQNYQIVFWDHTGRQFRTQTISLPPRGMWYLSQYADTALPDGFDGSAQIVNLSGGPLPVVAVDLDAGGFIPQSTLPLLNFHVYLPVTLDAASGG